MIFRRPVQIQPIPVRPGDDVIVSLPSAQEDALGLLGALQKQFPRTRIHLLIGFPAAVEVHRKQGGRDGESAGQEGQPQRTVQQQALASGCQPGPEGNVVLCTWAAKGRVVVVSVPPEE